MPLLTLLFFDIVGHVCVPCIAIGVAWPARFSHDTIIRTLCAHSLLAVLAFWLCACMHAYVDVRNVSVFVFVFLCLSVCMSLPPSLSPSLPPSLPLHYFSLSKYRVSVHSFHNCVRLDLEISWCPGLDLVERLPHYVASGAGRPIDINQDLGYQPLLETNSQNGGCL